MTNDERNRAIYEQECYEEMIRMRDPSRAVFIQRPSPSLTPDPIGTQRVMGVARHLQDAEMKTLSIYLTQPLTDDQLRSLHDYLRGWKP